MTRAAHVNAHGLIQPDGFALDITPPEIYWLCIIEQLSGQINTHFFAQPKKHPAAAG
jgi:hypothetical protein